MILTNTVERKISGKIKPSPLSIRLGVKNDANKLFPFNCELANARLDYQTFKKNYFKKLKNKEYTYLIAVDDHETVIGYISCRQHTFLHQPARSFEIEEVFVLQDYRSKEIGKTLMQSLEKALDIKSPDTLDITIPLKWGHAQSFFIKCGFELSHVRMRKA